MILTENRDHALAPADHLVQERLRGKQLEFIAANLRVSIAASLFNATIFLALLYEYLPRLELGLWYGAMILACVPRLFSIALFHKNRSRFSQRQWTWVFVSGTFVSGLIWGVSAPLFFVHLPPLGQAFHILLLGGTLAGAAIYLAHLLPCFIFFAIPHTVPMHILLISMYPDRFYLSMAFLFFVFSVMMFLMAYRTNRQFSSLNLLQLRNDVLLEKLNESEYLFRTLTEHSTAGVVLISDERLLYANPAAETITGYTLNELMNTVFWEIIDPEHRETVRARAARRMENAMPPLTLERSEFKIRHKSGSIRWIEYTPAVVEFQGRRVILGACSDITDRKLAQQARQESEERYRVLFETANDAMYVVGLDENDMMDLFRDANSLGCACLGYSREELLQLGPKDITHFYELKYGLEFQRRLQRDGQAVYEASHVTRDKRFIPVEVSAKLFSHEGKRAVLCIARDISERKESELKLQAAKKQAEVANQAKSEFLANMSHEIRTPLNGLLGMMQLIRMGDLDAERSKYLDVAMNSGENLLAIINDILDLSKIEAGKFELVPGIFDVRALVQSVIETFQFSAQSKGVRLETSIAQDMPRFINADQVRLRQILYNLVGNAVKFTHLGEIRVTLSLISKANGRGEIEIQVSDTGVGISKDQQAGLFEPFVQASTASRVRGSGTGLGLSIVKRIVGFMAGEVRLQSEPGKGTTVVVRVTVEISEQVPDSELSCARKATCCPVSTVGLRILVAEDNTVNQFMILKALEKLGHYGVCVQDGEEALERLRGETFDCVLMDIQMPGLDGTDVTRLIRRRALPEIDPDIPIIALTAYALSGDRERFLAHGMNGYLAKPVSIADLSAALSQIVPAKDA